MERYLVNEDIYDEKGLLLLRKGEIVNRTTLEKLRKHKIAYKSSIENDRQQTGKPINKDRFINKFRVLDAKLIDYPSKIVENIIFESKDQPWWIHVNLLSNYVNWLYTHSIDTSLISLMIGIKLNFTDAQLWNLALGSLLHDAGKLLIPKEILNRSEQLQDTEMIMIRQHCELGSISMKSYSLSDECIDIILHHHERLDGSGYPHGLKGDDISLNCKIVMIADTIDSITSWTYKDPRSMDMAIDLIKKKRKISSGHTFYFYFDDYTKNYQTNPRIRSEFI